MRTQKFTQTLCYAANVISKQCSGILQIPLFQGVYNGLVL